jgi:hypothetical protein
MATPTTLPATFVAGNVLTAAQMNDLRGAFRILQVVQAIKTDTYLYNSAAFIDVPDMAVTITPSSTSNKVLVICNVIMGTTNFTTIAKVIGGNMSSFLGAAAGSRIQTNMAYSHGGQSSMANSTLVYLDSPATTSATTYKLQIGNDGLGNQTVINRTFTDTNSAAYSRGASSILALEVSA